MIARTDGSYVVLRELGVAELIRFTKWMNQIHPKEDQWWLGWFEATTGMLHYSHYTVQTSCIFFPRLQHSVRKPDSILFQFTCQFSLKVPPMFHGLLRLRFANLPKRAKLQSDAGDRLLCLTNVPQLGRRASQEHMGMSETKRSKKWWEDMEDWAMKQCLWPTKN